jgi:hypothetical protein
MTDPQTSDRTAVLEMLRRLERATAESGEASDENVQETEQLGAALWAMLESNEELDEAAVRARTERLRARFYRELAVFEAKPERAPSLLERADRWLAAFWPSTRVAQAAVAAFTLLVGLGLGLTTQREGELARLERQMTNMGQTVALALLDHSAANERLRGVSLGAAALERSRDDEAALAIADGLLDVVGYDPSENVRLAAVEALARIADRPRVRSGLVEALSRQDSPMVQMTLADLVLASGDGDAEAAIRTLLQRDDLEPAVRLRLEELMGIASGDGGSVSSRPVPAKENA